MAKGEPKGPHIKLETCLRCHLKNIQTFVEKQICDMFMAL